MVRDLENFLLYSLMNITTFPGPNRLIQEFGRDSAYPALESLTIWLGPDSQAQRLVKALPAAPNLTTIIFVIDFDEGQEDLEEEREHLDDVLRVPWVGSESMKTFLKRRFPLLNRIGFHLCPPRDSDMHFRRGLRRRLERRVKRSFEADLGQYLAVEWFDDDHNPVSYSKARGKPPWKVSRSSWKEPETEPSDSESEKSEADSDEWEWD
jgi:hypothetical protein